jgi:hypothetical protein
LRRRIKTRVERRDVQANYNMMAIKDLEKEDIDGAIF